MGYLSLSDSGPRAVCAGLSFCLCALGAPSAFAQSNAAEDVTAPAASADAGEEGPASLLPTPLADAGEPPASEDAATTEAPVAEGQTKDAQPIARPSFESVVTGSRVQTETLKVPADVQVIDEQRLHRPGTFTAPAALTDVAGVRLDERQTNGVFNDIEIRGLGGNATSGGNVLILLDGIPQRRLSFGGPYLGALPFWDVTRMELVKGPVAALYGRNALTGALQLFTDPGSTTLHVDGMTTFQYPGAGLLAAAKASGPLGTSPIGGGKLSTFSIASDLVAADGWQPRVGQDKQDVYLHITLHLTDQDELTLLAGFIHATEGEAAPVFVDAQGHRLPGFDRDTNLAVPDQNSLELTEYRVAGRYLHSFTSAWQSKLTVSYWRGDTFWHVGRPDDQPATGTVAARSSSDRKWTENALFSEVEVDGKVQHDWFFAQVAAGASYEYLTYFSTQWDITTQDAFDATHGYGQGIPIDQSTLDEPGRSTWRYNDAAQRDTREHDAGAFARAQLAFFDRAFLEGGARYDWFRRTQLNPATGEFAAHNDWAVSPGVGLSVALLKTAENKLNLFGSWGRGFSPVFRAVNNTQFADVKPETSQDFDVGLKGRLWSGRIEGTLAAYQLQRFGVVMMDPVTKLQENAGDWRIRGLETELAVKPTSWLRFWVDYALRDPVITHWVAKPADVGNQIPVIPKNALTVGGQATAPFGLGGGTEVRYFSAAYGNEQNSFRLPAYALWDLWLSYDWLQGRLRTSVYVKNVTDTEYLSAVFSGVAIGSAFEGTPRTFGLELTGHL